MSVYDPNFKSQKGGGSSSLKEVLINPNYSDLKTISALSNNIG
jgi:hypothetical protein